LHSTFKVMEKADHTLFSDMLELHLIELPKLGRIDPQEQENEPSLVKWARFLAAADDEELSTAVQGDESMEKAKSYLDMLSAKPDVRKLPDDWIRDEILDRDLSMTPAPLPRHQK
jgi:hypothetical protein